MNYTIQVAKHIRDVHFGGNWTSVCLKDQLSGLTWIQATRQLHDFNTIAALVYHMNYYVEAISQVLRGRPLSSKDQFSFNHPPITSQADWERLVGKTFIDAENLATLVEQLPDSRLAENFYAEKYGSYYRNLIGVIEHIHYHLGQVVLIKKMLFKENKNLEKP